MHFPNGFSSLDFLSVSVDDAEHRYSQGERGSRMTSVPAKEPASMASLCFLDRCRRHGYKLSTTLLLLSGDHCLACEMSPRRLCVLSPCRFLIHISISKRRSALGMKSLCLPAGVPRLRAVPGFVPASAIPSQLTRSAHQPLTYLC